MGYRAISEATAQIILRVHEELRGIHDMMKLVQERQDQPDAHWRLTVDAATSKTLDVPAKDMLAILRGRRDKAVARLGSLSSCLSPIPPEPRHETAEKD